MRVDKAGHHPFSRGVYDGDIFRVGDLYVFGKRTNALDAIALDYDCLIRGGVHSRTVDQRTVLDDEDLIPIVGQWRPLSKIHGNGANLSATNIIRESNP